MSFELVVIFILVLILPQWQQVLPFGLTEKGKIVSKTMDVNKAIDIVEGLRDPNDEYEVLEAWHSIS